MPELRGTSTLHNLTSRIKKQNLDERFGFSLDKLLFCGSLQIHRRKSTKQNSDSSERFSLIIDWLHVFFHKGTFFLR